MDHFKIDGSFVRELDTSPLAAAVVHSITEIAHVLHKRTIAEHTESERLCASLTALGVDYAQGYAFDQPRPIDEYFGVVPVGAASAATATRAWPEGRRGGHRPRRRAAGDGQRGEPGRG